MQHPKLCVCEPCAFHICIPSKQLITATTVRFVTIPKKRLKIMEWGRFDMKLKLTHLMIAVQCFQFQKRILSIFLKQYVLTDESGINPVLIVNHDLISLEFKGERGGGSGGLVLLTRSPVFFSYHRFSQITGRYFNP